MADTKRRFAAGNQQQIEPAQVSDDAFYHVRLLRSVTLNPNSRPLRPDQAHKMRGGIVKAIVNLNGPDSLQVLGEAGADDAPMWHDGMLDSARGRTPMPRFVQPGNAQVVKLLAAQKQEAQAEKGPERK